MDGFDQWLTTQPEPVELPMPGEPGYPVCSQCGAFLRRDPDPGRTECGERWEDCNGQLGMNGLFPAECGKFVEHPAHRFIVAAWNLFHRVCKRCGHDNVEVDA